MANGQISKKLVNKLPEEIKEKLKGKIACETKEIITDPLDIQKEISIELQTEKTKQLLLKKIKKVSTEH